jgi:hypothetical protein
LLAEHRRFVTLTLRESTAGTSTRRATTPLLFLSLPTANKPRTTRSLPRQRVASPPSSLDTLLSVMHAEFQAARRRINDVPSNRRKTCLRSGSAKKTLPGPIEPTSTRALDVESSHFRKVTTRLPTRPRIDQSSKDSESPSPTTIPLLVLRRTFSYLDLARRPRLPKVSRLVTKENLTRQVR